MSDILTKDKNHFEIFSNDKGIKINKNLPKHILIKKHQDEIANEVSADEYKSKLPVDSNNLILDDKGQKKLENMSINLIEAFCKDSAHDFNILLSTKEFKEKFKLVSFEDFEFSISNRNILINDQSRINKKPSLFKKIIHYFKSENNENPEQEEFYEIDILEFFDFVKLETEDQKDKYKNRIKEYVALLKQCEITGQTALKEKLFKNIVINKYESILYAHGYTKLITEERLVEFVKKSKKGLSLTYIDNFTKIIPVDIMEKITEANKLEVFDNFAILHYDPEKKNFEKTQEDIKKENERRRDPICFGLIKNSNKLYYIGDWVDDYCDLTWDKVIETMGAQLLEKDYLVDKIDLKA